MSKYGPEFWNGESGAHRRVMMKAADMAIWIFVQNLILVYLTLFRKVLPELPICVRLRKR